ncbi:MAG: M28 family peptidase [Alphaproteobacteria bacterium]
MRNKKLNTTFYQITKKILVISLVLSASVYFMFDFGLKENIQESTTWVEVSPDIAAIKKDVNYLASLKRCWFFRKDLDEATAYIEKSLTQSGYKVTKQEFALGSPFNSNEKFTNLIVSYGDGNQKERIIVGAHYDTVNNPGADDNASAVAALLEIAKLLKQNNPKLNKQIDMVFYANEEPPFFATSNMGSARHYQLISKEKPKTTAMIALEMLGYYRTEKGSQKYPVSFMKYIYGDVGDFITVVGNIKGRKLVHNVYKGLSSTKLPAKLLVAPSIIPGLMFSDHLNYADKIPSVMITDTAFYRNPNYHKATDLPDTLDYDKLALAVTGTYRAIIDIANNY